MNPDATEAATNLPAQGEAMTTVGPVVGGGELLSMGLSMFVVVAVILVLGWIYSRSRLVSAGASDLIGIVATRALGPKERLLIVDVAGQQMLIGMTSTAVQTLHVFEEPVSEPQAAASSGFAKRLSSAFAEIRK
ncbi:MAG: flagellar biosynthetic protein FliO [Pseudomonadota bacterium]